MSLRYQVLFSFLAFIVWLILGFSHTWLIFYLSQFNNQPMLTGDPDWDSIMAEISVRENHVFAMEELIQYGTLYLAFSVGVGVGSFVHFYLRNNSPKTKLLMNYFLASIIILFLGVILYSLGIYIFDLRTDNLAGIIYAINAIVIGIASIIYFIIYSIIISKLLKNHSNIKP